MQQQQEGLQAVVLLRWWIPGQQPYLLLLTGRGAHRGTASEQQQMPVQLQLQLLVLKQVQLRTWRLTVMVSWDQQQQHPPQLHQPPSQHVAAGLPQQ